MIARAKAIELPCCSHQRAFLIERGRDTGELIFSGVLCLSCRRTYSIKSDEDRFAWQEVSTCWPPEHWPAGDGPAHWWAHAAGRHRQRRKRGLGR